MQCIPSAVTTVAVGAPGGGHSPFGVGTVGTEPELEPPPDPELDPVVVPELDPELDPELEPDPALPLELPLADASGPEPGVVTKPVGSEHDTPASIRQPNAVKAPSVHAV
jgi:hypothetical protein